MVVDAEYYIQKPTVEHWIGVALGRGIKVRVHDNTKRNLCSICKLPLGLLYGFNTIQENPVQAFEDKGY